MKVGQASARPAALLLLVLLHLLVAQKGLAQPEADEYEIKAAFLYNFASYVDWPPDTFQSSGDPVVFGVVGAPDLVDDLDMLGAARSVDGRPIEVRRLRRQGDAEGVHILFVANSLEERARELLESALDRGVLTVTESQDERPAASVINFQVIDNKVRFDVSLERAREAGLGISSRLLQVANRVL